MFNFREKYCTPEIISNIIITVINGSLFLL